MLSFWAVNGKAVVGPINVPPPQTCVFRRAAQTAETGQGKNQSPLTIRAGVENCLRLIARHKTVARLVGPHLAIANFGERADCDKVLFLSGFEKRLSSAASPPGRIVGKSWRH